MTEPLKLGKIEFFDTDMDLRSEVKKLRAQVQYLEDTLHAVRREIQQIKTTQSL